MICWVQNWAKSCFTISRIVTVLSGQSGDDVATEKGAVTGSDLSAAPGAGSVQNQSADGHNSVSMDESAAVVPSSDLSAASGAGSDSADGINSGSMDDSAADVPSSYSD